VDPSLIASVQNLPINSVALPTSVFIDSARDQPADPHNTFSYTLNLSQSWPRPACPSPRGGRTRVVWRRSSLAQCSRRSTTNLPTAPPPAIASTTRRPTPPPARRPRPRPLHHGQLARPRHRRPRPHRAHNRLVSQADFGAGDETSVPACSPKAGAATVGAHCSAMDDKQRSVSAPGRACSPPRASVPVRRIRARTCERDH
jgi:hypothetical protein